MMIKWNKISLAKWKTIVFLFGFSLPNFALEIQVPPRDELLVIQAVSKTGQTFIVRKGAEQGVQVGQTSLFSTENSSFAAMAIEVNRFFSQWRIKEGRGAVPFVKGEYITFNNNLNSVWSEIPKIQMRPADETDFIERNYFMARGSYSYGLDETTSDADDDKTISRSGFQGEFLYFSNFYPQVHIGGGLRIDRDIFSIQEPSLEIYTTRVMAAVEFQYHLRPFERSRDNLYFGLGMAYGRSSTQIEESVSTGTSFVLPTVKVGYVNNLSKRYDMVVELALETLNQDESFVNEDTQNTQITSTKIALGLRF